jgi:outer membrane immunogenic protein
MEFRAFLIAAALVAGSVVGIGILPGASPARAADLPTTKAPPAPPPPQAFSWTGFYFGVNGGLSASDTSLRPVLGGAFLTSPALPLFEAVYPSRASNDQTGFVGGAQIGYNWQVSNFVFGLEADIDYQQNHQGVTSISPIAPPAATPNVIKTFGMTDGWFGTLRPRVGVAIDRALVYATGGLAFGQETSRVFITDSTAAPSTWSGSSSATRVGWALGAGLEYAVTQNWSVKGEYLHVDLGSHNYALASAATNASQSFTMSATENNRFDVVRAGVNYRF